jgi:hypothetical protein
VFGNRNEWVLHASFVASCLRPRASTKGPAPLDFLYALSDEVANSEPLQICKKGCSDSLGDRDFS